MLSAPMIELLYYGGFEVAPTLGMVWFSVLVSVGQQLCE
jgi:hypothetical protein